MGVPPAGAHQQRDQHGQAGGGEAPGARGRPSHHPRLPHGHEPRHPLAVLSASIGGILMLAVAALAFVLTPKGTDVARAAH
ncbi:hypothetical protein GCM10027070_07200 [Barrientosiimonas humi]